MSTSVVNTIVVLHVVNRSYSFQCLVPVSVAEDNDQGTLFSPSPNVYVRNAVRTLGVTSYTHGYLPHALWVSGQILHISRVLYLYLVEPVYKDHLKQQGSVVSLDRGSLCI